MSGDEIKKERLKQLEILKSRGIDPYPANSDTTHTNKEFIDQFTQILKEKEIVTLAGRIMSIRDQGGIIFLDLLEEGERVQIILRKDDIEKDSFDLFLAAISIGDIIEATGSAFITKRNVNSLLSKDWKILTKSLNQIPSEWFGIKNEDERYRKRYVDMIINPKAAEMIRKKSIFWNAFREFLLNKGFIEVETPVLQNTTGGAEALPFITHHNALDIDVYLRISLELWQKRLLIAGFRKVFELGRIFRNEGMSFEHAQDYTQLETYEAYADARESVPFLIEMYKYVAQKTFGTLEFQINSHKVDLAGEWKKYDFKDLMEKEYGFNVYDVDFSDGSGLKLIQKYSDSQYKGPIQHIGRAVDYLWKKICKNISGPAILSGIPIYLEPLAKASKENPKKVDRFQIIIAGSEVGKGFNELNDPQEQRKRFNEQEALREKGDGEAQMLDNEFLEALEYGMPPAFGFGISERFFSFLVNSSIRETQAFPLMRPQKKNRRDGKDT